MLDPRTGRARLREDGGTLYITIPSKTHVFSSIFVGFWLIGWAIGWLAAFGMLLQGAGWGSLFILGWLGAWTFGGIAAFSLVLWNLAGKEQITITPTTLTVTRKIPFWKRQTECALASVSGLRAAPAPAMPAFSKMTRGVWAARSDGEVTFTYGVHTIGFALEIDVPEAQKMVELIHNRFPQLTKQA